VAVSGEGGGQVTYHLYYLRRDLRDVFAKTIAHAVCTDLVQWTVVRDAIQASPNPKWDSGWFMTGMVVQHHNGQYHMFYGAMIDGVQRIGVARSDDLYHFSRPVFATVAILQFLGHWGSFLWPLMTTRGDTYQPLPVAMQTLFGQAPRQWGDVMAFAAIVTIPVLIVFLLFQKWFIQSVSSSGVKG
jgi:hypothetical protein